MTRILFIALLTIILFQSCSKNNASPKVGSIMINGKTYETIKIGNQTWTSVNYDGNGGVANPNFDESSYGKLYTLTEVKAINLPTGWRVPTQADLTSLFSSQATTTLDIYGRVFLDSISAMHLRSTNGWDINGDNKSGFNARPIGEYDTSLQNFTDFGKITYFWSSTPGLNTVELPSQCVVELDGYHTISNLGLLPQEVAVVDPSRGGLHFALALRFVKDN